MKRRRILCLATFWTVGRAWIPTTTTLTTRRHQLQPHHDDRRSQSHSLVVLRAISSERNKRKDDGKEKQDGFQRFNSLFSRRQEQPPEKDEEEEGFLRGLFRRKDGDSNKRSRQQKRRLPRFDKSEEPRSSATKKNVRKDDERRRIREKRQKLRSEKAERDKIQKEKFQREKKQRQKLEKEKLQRERLQQARMEKERRAKADAAKQDEPALGGRMQSLFNNTKTTTPTEEGSSGTPRSVIQKMFDRPPEQWVTVFPKTRIMPGQMVPVTVAGLDLLVVASKDARRLYCIANSCPHLGTPFETGTLVRLPVESNSKSPKPVSAFNRLTETDVSNILQQDGCEDCIVCPLHRTAFALESGEVRGEWCPYPPVLGPTMGAVKKPVGAAVFDVRTRGKNVEVRINTPLVKDE